MIAPNNIDVLLKIGCRQKLVEKSLHSLAKKKCSKFKKVKIHGCTKSERENCSFR